MTTTLPLRSLLVLLLVLLAWAQPARADGLETCDDCGGAGKIACVACPACARCAGTAKVPCEACQGKPKGGVCAACKSLGVIVCPACDAGKSRACPACKGTRQTKCPTCGGKTKMPPREKRPLSPVVKKLVGAGVTFSDADVEVVEETGALRVGERRPVSPTAVVVLSGPWEESILPRFIAEVKPVWEDKRKRAEVLNRFEGAVFMRTYSVQKATKDADGYHLELVAATDPKSRYVTKHTFTVVSKRAWKPNDRLEVPCVLRLFSDDASPALTKEDDPEHAILNSAWWVHGWAVAGVTEEVKKAGEEGKEEKKGK